MKESDLEVMCNYQNLTRDVFEAILQERKDLQAAKDTYHVMKVDLDQFPSWTQGNVDRLRYTFQVFDVSGDGLVDFDELYGKQLYNLCNSYLCMELVVLI